MSRKRQLCKIVVGMIGKTSAFDNAKEKLVIKFGDIDYESPVLPFDKTDYYAKEMGKELKRKFVSFSRLTETDSLVDLKMLTMKMEKELSDDQGNRRVNLDPGYLTPGKLVLATTKNLQHRIYIRRGIFAEVTLRYVNGSFRQWEWTYPDYRTRAYIDIFNRIRKILMEQLKEP